MTTTPEDMPAKGKTIPMLLVLGSETMNDPATPTTNTPRRFVVEEAVKDVSRVFSSISPNIPKTGLRTFAFMNGGVHDLGYLNPQTARDRLKQITWDGMPSIGPGLTRLAQVYHQEHSSGPSTLVATVITDTVASDIGEFAQTLNDLDEPISVNIAVLGCGNDYTNTINAYTAIANEHPNVNVFRLGEWAEPKAVADQLVQTFS